MTTRGKGGGTDRRGPHAHHPEDAVAHHHQQQHNLPNMSQGDQAAGRHGARPARSLVPPDAAAATTASNAAFSRHLLHPSATFSSASIPLLLTLKGEQLKMLLANITGKDEYKMHKTKAQLVTHIVRESTATTAAANDDAAAQGQGEHQAAAPPTKAASGGDSHDDDTHGHGHGHGHGH